MSAHGVIGAKNRLSQLIDRALRGDEIVITCHGRSVVVLEPVAKPARAVSAADLDWLAEHRVGRSAPLEGAGVPLTNLRNANER